jgi:hypothetical protein
MGTFSNRAWSRVWGRWWVGLVVVGYLLSACGSVADPGQSRVRIIDGATPSVPVVVSSTTAPVTTVATTTSTTSASSTSTTQPLGPGPHEGDVVAVVGVAIEDMLNVRMDAGVENDVVTRLPPDAAGVVTTGATAQSGRITWWEVTYGGVTGWSASSFLGYLGESFDGTEEVVAALSGVPSEKTFVDLGWTVAMSQAVIDGDEVVSRVRHTAGNGLVNSQGLFGITFDVIGVADDSVGGLRLRIVGQALSAGQRYELKSVEVTPICHRGVHADGSCL